MTNGPTTREHPNVTRVRRAIAAHHAGDRSPDDVHAEDLVVTAPGTSPLGGEIRGRAEVMARLARLKELSAGTFAPRSTQVSGDGPFVFVLHQVTAARGDRRLDQALAETWRFEGDRCVEARLQFEDVAAWDAFWG